MSPLKQANVWELFLRSVIGWLSLKIQDPFLTFFLLIYHPLSLSSFVSDYQANNLLSQCQPLNAPFLVAVKLL